MNLGLDDTLTRLRINSAVDAAGHGIPQTGILPYDPSNPPDDAAGIVNVASNQADNTDYDFSKASYTGVGGGTDADYECYNWYRQLFIKLTDVVATSASNAITSAVAKFAAGYTYPMPFVLLGGGGSSVALTGYLNRTSNTGASLFTDAGMGTPLNSSATMTGGVLWFGTALAETAANALKAVGHSLYAANEGANTIIPRWDRTNGWGELGSTGGEAYDIACPLPVNFIRAGVRYYFRVLVTQRSGTTATTAARVSVGIWDETAGRKRFLEGSNLALSVTPVGTAGATTYDYRVLADLDDGTTLMSDVTTIANGNATLSASNYNRLTWQNSTGILRLRIYRSTGGVIKRVFTVTNGANDYNDYGTDEGETPVAMPTAPEQRPIAYVVSPQFTLQGNGTWLSFLIALDIPATYDSSTTTGKQWLRFTVEGTETDARAFLFDRVMLSTDNGGWQRSARDLNKISSQTPTSVPTSDGGQGGGGIDRCFVLSTPVTLCDEDGQNMRKLPIGEVERGDFVYSGGRRVNRVVRIRDSISKTVISIRMSNGVEFECSPSERFITSRADREGTRLDDLTAGDEILSIGADGETVERSTITVYGIRHGTTKVRTLSLRGGKTFVAGHGDGLSGVIAHNNKGALIS